jgi:exosortase
MGLVLFLCGTAWFKKSFIPLAYLVFMVPLPAVIWNRIAFPMQLFGSYLTEQAVYFIGIPIYREGNVLHLAETTLEVVAACSGLRSLVTLFALAGALAFFSKLSNWRKWILFFTAAPIAIFANIVRLTMTAILASYYGSEVAQGFLHDFSGLVIFVLGLSLLVGISSLLARK